MPRNQATWVDTKQDELRAVGAFVLHVQVIRLIMTLKKNHRDVLPTRHVVRGFVLFSSFLSHGEGKGGDIFAANLKQTIVLEYLVMLE